MANAGVIEALLRLRDEMSPALERAGKSVQQAGRTMQNLGTSLAPMSAGLAAIGGGALKAAVDFESSFAGVRKTVDATEAEFAKLSAGFREMSREIPTSVNELNRIGEAAGQLGIETDNILSFTRTMADLGVTTNLSSDEAATALARLANITQMPQTNFDRLGSTIVALGNNLATTEAEITEFGLRIAGAGSQVGLSEAQILSIGAALSSVGINAEAGGTAISRVMIDLASSVEEGGARLEQFAAIAGQTGAEFATRFRTDAAGALSDFISGLGQMEERGQSTLGVLSAMGLENVRIRDALLRAAGAGDLVARSLEIGSQAWSENVALSREAEQRYNTTASQLKLLWNQISDVAISLGEALVPTLKEAMGVFRDTIPMIEGAVKWFADLPSPVQKAVFAIGALGVAASPVAFGLGSIVNAVGSIVKIFPGMIGFVGKAGSAVATLGKSLGVTAPLLAKIGVVAAVGAGAFKFTQWLVESTGGAKILHTTLGNLINSIRGVNTAALEAGTQNLGAAVSQSLRFQEGETQAAFQARIQEAAAAAAKLREQYQQTADATDAVTVATGGATKAIDPLALAFGKTADTVKTMTQRIDEAVKSIREAKLDEEAKNIATFLEEGIPAVSIPVEPFNLDDIVPTAEELALPAIDVGPFKDATDAAIAQLEEMRRKTQEQQAVAANLRSLGFSEEDIRKVVGTIEDAVDSTKLWTEHLKGLTSGLGIFGKAFQPLLSTVGGFLDDVTSSFASKMGGLFGGAGGGGLLSGIMQGGLSALMGPAGPLSGIMQAGMSQLAGVAMKGIKAIGGAIKGLFGGPSAEEVAGRDLVASFEDSLIATLDATQRAEAGGERWKQTVIAVRDAYVAAGSTAAAAEAAVKRLWESSKDGPAATQAAIAEIESVMGQAEDATSGAASALDQMSQADLANLATSVDPEALAASTAALETAADAASSAAAATDTLTASGLEIAQTFDLAAASVQGYVSALTGVPSSITFPVPVGAGGDGDFSEFLPGFQRGGRIEERLASLRNRVTRVADRQAGVVPIAAHAGEFVVPEDQLRNIAASNRAAGAGEAAAALGGQIAALQQSVAKLAERPASVQVGVTSAPTVQVAAADPLAGKETTERLNEHLAAEIGRRVRQGQGSLVDDITTAVKERLGL